MNWILDDLSFVSMPRRAEFIFYRCNARWACHGRWLWFQCPEGLNLFSILTSLSERASYLAGFNAPKG